MGSCFSGFSIGGVVGGVSEVELREGEVAQHEYVLHWYFGRGLWRRRGSGSRRDSGCRGRALALSEAGYLEAAPAIWASARSELSGEAVNKSIWRRASAESERDQGL
ncbi:MAG: hypothetical protein GY821_08065 [Gammaproteobacteria bacterium]|nr:hypothetical protein [Gammaproteobacteria bacterium]